MPTKIKSLTLHWAHKSRAVNIEESKTMLVREITIVIYKEEKSISATIYPNTDQSIKKSYMISWRSIRSKL